MALEALGLGLSQFLSRVAWMGGHSLSFSLGISRGEEYRDPLAASSPGFSAPRGQVDVSPFLLVSWERGSFKQPPLHLYST